MQSKSYKRWLSRVNDTTTPWSENEIIYFRKALGFCGLANPVQRATLLQMFERTAARNVYRITPEQDVRGQQYLLTKSLRVNGGRRKGCRLQDDDLCILRNLNHHLFVGLWPQVNGLGETLGYLPIYRAVSGSGHWFDYIGTVYEGVQVLGRTPNAFSRSGNEIRLVVS